MIKGSYLVPLDYDEILNILSGLMTFIMCVRDRVVPEFETEEERKNCLAEITTAINTLYDTLVN